MEKLLIILRGLSVGHKTIFVDKNRNYISKQVDCFQTKGWVEGCEEVPIEDRLKFELYGEFPLSELNELDYSKNVKPCLCFNLGK